MPKKVDSVLELIGDTPIVRLNKLPEPGSATVWAKLEMPCWPMPSREASYLRSRMMHPRMVPWPLRRMRDSFRRVTDFFPESMSKP